MTTEDLLREVQERGALTEEEKDLARAFLNEASADQLYAILNRHGFAVFRHSLQLEVFRQYNRIYDFVNERIYGIVLGEMRYDILLKINLSIRKVVRDRGDLDILRSKVRRVLAIVYGNMTVDVAAETERRRRIEMMSRRPPGGEPEDDDE